jgi:hypothetical protein
MYKLIVPTILLLALAAGAQAQNAGPPARGGQQQSAEDRFKQYDTNKDGKLSVAEYVAGGGAQSGNAQAGKESKATREERFKSMDKSKDNFLSLDEYQTGRGNNRSGGNSRSGGKAGGATKT